MSQKKRILLIGDTPGWAFHRIIEFIQNNIPGYDFFFDFTVNHPRTGASVSSDFVSRGTVSPSPVRTKWPFQNMYILRGLVYRTVKFLHWIGLSKFDENGFVRKIASDNCYDLVVYLDYYMDKDADFDHIKAPKVIKGIFTEQFPPAGVIHKTGLTPKVFVEEFLNGCNALLVGSPSSVKLYSKAFKQPIFFANLCYDEFLFVPKMKKKRQSFVIGWTGNPDREFKGFYSHVLPTIKALQAMGYPVEFRSQFAGSLSSLATFWQDIDLALITSEADAGPSMFIEASLCGVPSVSTKIGLPSFVIEDGVNGLFCERRLDDMLLKIQRLLDEPELHQRLKTNIRASFIKELGVEAQKKRWDKLFNAVLNE